MILKLKDGNAVIELFEDIAPNHVKRFKTLSLEKKYDEIITIEIDENNFVAASIINKKGEYKSFYINPKTGEKIGDLIKKSRFYDFITNLHRSLFLKSTGRLLIGFVSFILFIIAITGIILILD